MGQLHFLPETLNDKGSHLVSGKPGKGPGGKGDAVDGTDIFHSIVVGKQGRHITEASAVSGVYHKQQDQHQDHKEGVLPHVGNALGKDYQPRSGNGKNENNFVNGIPVLKGIRPGGEAKTPPALNTAVTEESTPTIPTSPIHFTIIFSCEIRASPQVMFR